LNAKDEYIDGLTKENQDMKKKIEELQGSTDSLRKTLQEVQNKAITYRTTLEQTKYKLEETTKQMTAAQALKQEPANTGNEVINSGDLNLELDAYRSMIRCNICKNRKKDVVLKCGHTFCGQCIETKIKMRNRECPLCRRNISTDDVKPFWWQ